MGAYAALKAREVARNVLRVVAIELLCGAQGLEFRELLRPGRVCRGARFHPGLGARFGT